MSGEAKYRSYPGLEPYTSTERYKTPKEDFKTICARLETLLEPGRTCKAADLGCGNGALLYYLHGRYPAWDLYGYDATKEYIETARRFEGLRAVKFFHQDFFEIQETFDIVLSTCLLSIFKNVAPPLRKMLDLCRPGGFVLVTGLFNPFDIEVRVEFCDNSRPETRGQWRPDFNRHSQESIRRLFGGEVQSIDFEECPFEIDIPRDLQNPIRVWTLDTADGKKILINGAHQICNQTLMIVKK
jgi:SAM-dependent methyltransferase